MVGEEGVPRKPAGRTVLARDLQMAIPTVIAFSVASTRVPGLTPTSASAIEDFTRPTDSATSTFLPWGLLANTGRVHPGGTVQSGSFRTGPGPVQMDLCAESKVGLLEMTGLWREQDRAGQGFNKPGVPCDVAWHVCLTFTQISI